MDGRVFGDVLRIGIGCMAIILFVLLGMAVATGILVGRWMFIAPSNPPAAHGGMK